MTKNADQPFSFDEDIDRRVVPALKVHPIVLGHDGADLFPAGVADMDFKAPPSVLDALQKRLDHGVFGYETFADGLLPSLTGWLDRQHGWRVEEKHILQAPNILNVLAIATSLFTNEGDAVIVQPPVFFDFFDVLRENHRSIVTNPLLLEDGRYRMDFDDLEQKASDPRTRMIYLCNPQNPVGRVWTEQELRTLGDICAIHNVLVVSDDMHSDLILPGYRYTPFASLGPDYAANSITCLSPAKTFNIPSCSSAFTLVANDERRKAFQVENSRLTVNKNNAFTNVAMQAAFTSGGTWLQAALTYLEGNVELVREQLKAIPGVELIEPEATFLVWLNFNKLGFLPDELTVFLRTKARWGVTRGHSFGLEGSGFARVNIACTRARLEAALGQLNRAVTAL